MTPTPQAVGSLADNTNAIHHLEHVMGTVVTIDVYTEVGHPDREVYPLLDKARATLQRADSVFSTWKANSPISRLRRGEIAIDQTPAEVAEVLESCAIARKISRGWFDPWAMPGGVDPTGYVKGWATQRALAALNSDGIPAAIVNAAGDIASFGGLGYDNAFRIGIVDPFSSRQLACVVELVGSIATSGTYERGEHLIDPYSGRPVARAASASVCGPDLGLADALATAIAVAGEPGLEIVESLEDYEAFIISFDGTWRWTEQFPFASPDASSSISRSLPPSN
jgi:thiamine biosynthesis lipoprotein